MNWSGCLPANAESIRFLAIISISPLLLYHYPLFQFAVNSFSSIGLAGVQAIALIGVIVTSVNVFIFALLMAISIRMTKWVLTLLWLLNAVAVYFLLGFDVILDRTMLGNIISTNVAEAREYFSARLLVYVVLLGVLPIWLITRIRVAPVKRLQLIAVSAASLPIGVVAAYLGASSWLWIDKNAQQLGGLVLPWSYLANAYRYGAAGTGASDSFLKIPPPNHFSEDRAIVILVIGETARAQNFAFYGYDRDTNPMLRAAGAVPLAHTTSCATYTTQALRCILQPRDTSSEEHRRLEPFPTYLARHDVDVIWRSNNWSEPRLEVTQYERARDLRKRCTGTLCNYDDVLLTGLKRRIQDSSHNKVLVVLHQRGSHGPAYHERYPSEFEVFSPTCRSSDLSGCSTTELVNAYDNSLVYTDAFISNVINTLEGVDDRRRTLIYISDHGESLGERGLYLHGTPRAIAPIEQVSIPFIIWSSPENRTLGARPTNTGSRSNSHTQENVFHSVLGALGIRNSLYDERLDVFAFIGEFNGPKQHLNSR